MADQEKTKEELLKELKRYKDIVENANSIILIMDTSGRITFFNNYAQRFFGYYENEIIGKSVIGTIVPKTDTAGSDLTEMVGDIVTNPEKHGVNENENIRSNGERVWIAWTNKAIIDSDGRIKEILCIGNDISKLKKDLPS